MIKIVIILLMSFSFLTKTVSAQTNNNGLPYLGQTPPGDTPKVFAPGIISLQSRLETYPTFSPGGNEMFFSVVNKAWTTGTILHTMLRDGRWSTPDTASFSRNQYINWESSLSPDGKVQFFASCRPPSTSMDIWMTKRIGDSAWSDPVRLASPVNSNADDGSACMTSNGTLYFKSKRAGGIGGSWLYRADLHDSSQLQVQSLGNNIKTTRMESEPFMAPDESYLIFISSGRAGGRGGWDLWITYKKFDNSWTRPINMGPEINTERDEYGPRVTTDGKYLFFTRDNGSDSMDIYWVSTHIIDSLHHANFAPYVNLPIPDQVLRSGYSFSYTIPDSTFIDDNGNASLCYSCTQANGSPLPAWLIFNASTRTFSAVAGLKGSLRIKVTATDTAGAQSHCTFTITIVDAMLNYSDPGTGAGALPSAFPLHTRELSVLLKQTFFYNQNESTYYELL